MCHCKQSTASGERPAAALSPFHPLAAARVTASFTLRAQRFDNISYRTHHSPRKLVRWFGALLSERQAFSHFSALCALAVTDSVEQF